ncbi:GvpL/GvpF family gas vesicle protein [Mycobacterium sp.]|uniref:GvpL/GvpF family gas vesicle protein n=1 Tax=Mycobacterium sp. TaxID=1785 RepID=UPI003F7DBD11
MTTSDQLGNQAQGTQRQTGIYVYGIVPADLQVDDDARGVGDPPGRVEVIREGDVGALVSEVQIDRALGTPDDLQAHEHVLDRTASIAPVLPMRFGAVLTDADSVATEVLRDHHDEFAKALSELKGRAEYIVRGRYNEKAILSEVLSENAQAQALRDDIRSKPEDASRDSQMALGEIISNAIEATRQADTQTVVNALEGVASLVNVRPPTHEYDAIHVAMLAETDRQSAVEQALNQLRENWGDRMQLRLLGPLAAYDFVVANAPGG